MYDSIDLIKEAYIKELKEYIIWTEKAKKQYGKLEVKLEVLCWDSHDYEKIMKWNDSLNRIEKILGVSKQESKELQEQILSKING